MKKISGLLWIHFFQCILSFVPLRKMFTFPRLSQFKKLAVAAADIAATVTAA